MKIFGALINSITEGIQQPYKNVLLPISLYSRKCDDYLVVGLFPKSHLYYEESIGRGIAIPANKCSHIYVSHLVLSATFLVVPQLGWTRDISPRIAVPCQGTGYKCDSAFPNSSRTKLPRKQVAYEIIVDSPRPSY